IWKFLSFCNNWYIGFQETVTYFGDKVVPVFHTHGLGCFAIIKKQATHASGLVTVRIPEIVVAFLFIGGIKFGMVDITGLFTGLMKMDGIFLKKIVGREVLTATEPLIHNVTLLVVHFKIAPIGMNGGNHRIFGMKHQA